MTFFELLDDEVEVMEAPIVPFAPCPTPERQHDPHAPHVLVVHDDPDEGFTIEHPDGCPSFESTHLGCTVHECAVEFTVENSGVEEFFTHVENGYDVLAREAAILIPGRYLIEYHEERYPGGPWGPTEYDAWLQLIYPEEAQQPARP